MFKRLLIANRGEIACRINKTAQKMGITTIAVYADADKNSLHVRLADEAYRIGESIVSESYLNIDAIIHQARLHQADAIHPGYGFLSENADFAKACLLHDIVFIGPSVEALKIMGSKQESKKALSHTNVPLIPGYHGSLQTPEQLLQEAKKIGFPVLLKAAFGGGGKGMRMVDEESKWFDVLNQAQREAMHCFGNDTMIIEKQLLKPRHIEVQLLCDHHGQILHLYERDCSIQRRHQKLIEEAPALNLSPSLREKMFDAAITVAKTISYTGVGTVEFLVDASDDFYFIEMNTRLQVEHPVTEMITKLDLVEWQIRVAANAALPWAQKDIPCTGHAIECRIYAEDTHSGLPSTGSIHYLKSPTNPDIRIDSGIDEQSIVSPFYDPLLLKIMAYGETRDNALAHLNIALNQLAIGGVKTNLALLSHIVKHPDFIHSQFTTHFIENNPFVPQEQNTWQALILAASFDYLNIHTDDPIQEDAWAWHRTSWPAYYEHQGITYCVTVTPINRHEWHLQWDKHGTVLKGHLGQGQNVYELTLDHGQCIQTIDVTQQHHLLTFFTPLSPLTIKQHHDENPTTAPVSQNQLTAPMPATVVAILKQQGESVAPGDALLVLEAMKMEHTIHAPMSGLIAEVFYAVGDQVDEGVLLVALETIPS